MVRSAGRCGGGFRAFVRCGGVFGVFASCGVGSGRLPGAAQTDLSPVEAHRYADELLLWQHTRNAAGLSLDSTAARGSSFFQYRHTDGTHFRVQEGDGSDGLRFRSHQFRPIGTWLRAYGTFCFDMGRTRHRAWSDVSRTDEGNPYLSGSPVAANYDL